VVGRTERFPGAPHLLRGPQLRRARQGNGLHRPRAAVLLPEAGRRHRGGRAGQTATIPYPSLTANLHHEIELVVAIGKGGRTSRRRRPKHIYGYAVGLDMTRRDLQNDMKKQGRPWCIGKAFDHSAPIGPITPAAQAGDIATPRSGCRSTAADRQRSNVSKLIWNIAETIEHLSAPGNCSPAT
jgi:fumarylpyruvate hydrolase